MKSVIDSNKGFTLVELLIAIGLLAILTGALFTVFNPFDQIRKSQDVTRKSDLSQIQKSLELYYQDTGRYPPSTLDFKISVNGQPINWGNAWNPYIAKLPADPDTAKRYIYYVPDPSGQTYYIYASLAKSNDKQACNNGDACVTASSGPGANACGGVCNFGLTSPNVTP